MTKAAVSIPVADMTCASCVARVEKALRAVPGVVAANVNLATGRADLRLDEPVPMARLVEAVERTGYTVPEQTTELAIEGMTCASCVARVEKALAAVPGVSSAAVNLATERATVRGTADVAALEAAVRAIGYDARVAGDADAPAAGDRHDAEAAVLRRDVILAAALTVPIFLVEMGGHIVPALHHWIASRGLTWPLWVAEALLTALVLAGPGRRFFVRGLPALARGAPDMNSLVAVGTLAAFGYSLVATFAPALLPAGSVAVYYEAAAVIVTLILLGRMLEAGAKGRTSQAIRRLVGLAPRTARVRGRGEVPLAEVRTGDVIEIRPGERVPVDGTVLEGTSHVDEAMITGEPVPVDKAPSARLTGGTVNGTGALTMQATAVGADTVLAQIVRMVEQAQGAKLPIQAMVDRVTLWFVPAVMAAAALTLVAWLALGAGPGVAIVNAVAVLIVACPCAMGLATPTSIMVGTGRAAEMGVLFRGGDALQALHEVRTVALDKTGTLTAGHPALTDLILAPGADRAATLAAIAAVEARSEHPIARAIVAAAEAEGIAVPEAADFASVTGAGAQATVAGQPVAVGSGRWMEEMGLATAPFATDAARLADAGRTPLFAAVGGRLAAMLAVADPVKPDTPAAIADLHRSGLRVAVITGDSARTAAAIAGPLGIDTVIAEVPPAGKVAALQRLRAEGGGTVAFVGDGINDAPALAEADVGLAIGTGTDIAIEAADVVLMSGSLGGVPRAIAISRAVIRNIRQNLFWAFAYNVALIPLAAAGRLSPMLAAGAMGLSSVFVLGNALRLRGFQPQAATRPRKTALAGAARADMVGRI